MHAYDPDRCSGHWLPEHAPGVQRQWLLRADSNPGTTDSYPNGDTDTNPDAAYADANTDTAAYTDPNPDAAAYTDPNTTPGNPDANPDCNCDTDDTGR